MNALIDAGVPREAFAHIGFLLIALAFVVRDPLVLHSRAIAAYCCFIGFATMAAGGPIWHLIFWYVVFLAINLFQVGRLVYERRFDGLSDDERRLASCAFTALDICAVKRLIRRGVWSAAARGEALTVEGQPSDRLFAILEGRVRVMRNGALVCVLGPGQFIGEIGFVAATAATATAIAESETVRVLAWRIADLRRRGGNNAEIRGVVNAAIGADLARKIADQTLRLTHAGTGARDDRIAP